MIDVKRGYRRPLPGRSLPLISVLDTATSFCDKLFSMSRRIQMSKPVSPSYLRPLVLVAAFVSDRRFRQRWMTLRSEVIHG